MFLWGLTFWLQQLFPFQEISDKFTDHHELANKLLIKKASAGVEPGKGEALRAIHQTETKKTSGARRTGAAR